MEQIRNLSNEELCVAIVCRCDRLEGALRSSDFPSATNDCCLCSLLREVRRRLLEVCASEAENASQNATCQQEATTQQALDLLQHAVSPRADLPARLVAGLRAFSFEARKSVMNVFAAITEAARTVEALGGPLMEYVVRSPAVASSLVQGCGDAEVALYCSDMLRGLTKFKSLVHFLLDLDTVETLWDFMDNSDIEISMQASKCLNDLLTAYPEETLQFLAPAEKRFDPFFAKLHYFVTHEDMWLQRPGYALLIKILELDALKTVLRKYVANDRFLRIHMNLLRSESRQIQKDAFIVLEKFVMSKESDRVEQILMRNHVGLREVLTSLANRMTRDDEQILLKDMIQVIGMLPQSPTPASAERRQEELRAQQPQLLQAMPA